MSSYRQRLTRRPAGDLVRLHTETAQAVNQMLDGVNDAVFEDDVGVVLKGPDGHYWRVGVTTAGALTTVDLGTSRP